VPKVSVLMSVYNGARYLREAVDSILCQTYTDFELIVIDDGSTDETGAILDGYDDARIVRLTNEQNIGLTKSLNKGLGMAKGEYVARMDADDIALPDRLQLQVHVLDTRPEVVLVSGNIDLIDAAGQVWRRPRRNADPGLVAWFLLFHNYLGGHSQVMFRHSSVLSLGGYSEERPYAQDYALWLRLAEIGRIAMVPDVILQHRCHDENLTSMHSLEQEEYSLRDSQRALARLLDQQPSVGEVSELRAFWQSPLPDPDAASRIGGQMKQIQKAFLSSWASRGMPTRRLARKVSWRIGRRFLAWAHVALLDYRMGGAARLLWYSASWYLGGLSACCARSVIT